MFFQKTKPKNNSHHVSVQYFQPENDFNSSALRGCKLFAMSTTSWWLTSKVMHLVIRSVHYQYIFHYLYFCITLLVFTELLHFVNPYSTKADVNIGIRNIFGIFGNISRYLVRNSLRYLRGPQYIFIRLFCSYSNINIISYWKCLVYTCRCEFACQLPIFIFLFSFGYFICTNTFIKSKITVYVSIKVCTFNCKVNKSFLHFLTWTQSCCNSQLCDCVEVSEC